MSAFREAIAKLGTLDRRVIFVLMALAIVIPTAAPLGLPFAVSQPVQDIYDEVEALGPGSKVLVAVDFDPGSKPELYPFLLAVYRHLFSKEGVVVITSSLWPAAPPLANAALETVAVEEYGKEYGKDFVNLGFKEGKHIVILGMGESIPGVFPQDYRGTPLAELAAMQGIQSLKDFDLIINISAGTPGTKEWVQLAQSRYSLKMAAACTAVSAPDYIPYYQSGQLVGLSGGMAGSAEYEKLIGRAGLGTAGMDVLSIGHLLIVVAIILGNISYFMTRRRRRGGR